MKQFVLLIKENMEVIPKDSDLSQMESRYKQWMDELIASGNYVTGSRLDIKRKTLQPDGAVISDGPYVETKEMIGGLIIIRAQDMDQALRLTLKCPMHKIHDIDLREVKYEYNI